MFKQIADENPIAEVILSAFDTKLPVSGAWGYKKTEATIINSYENTSPIQLEHMLASMRTFLEMNMMLPEEERYGSINLNEISREHMEDRGKRYDKVLYEITAMNEKVYAGFIKEYKESYGKDSFDMEDHFKRRKAATLTRIVAYWFDTTEIV